MWEKYKPHICMYLKKGLKDEFDQIPLSNENVIIKSLLEYYRKYFYKKNILNRKIENMTGLELQPCLLLLGYYNQNH